MASFLGASTAPVHNPDKDDGEGMYDNKDCPLRIIFSMSGSVFPQALMVAVPNLAITVVLFYIVKWNFPDYVDDMVGVGGGQLWSSYNIAMGLLLVFRTQQAYSRWWEGGTLLQQVRGEWYNATSSLFAFSSTDKEKSREVLHFQHLLVRLMSMLYCSALQQVAALDDDNFEIIDATGVERAKLEYLRTCHDRCEVLVQWIQRLIVTNMGNGVLTIPPPVISRVFHELSRGIVNQQNVRKIKQFPFPFPYAQMVTFMLLIHWVLTPIINVMLVNNLMYSALLSFVSIFAFWSINYIAVEIEMPFGSDANDLPISHMQRDMNRSLLVLLDKRVQEPPSFDYKESVHKWSELRANGMQFESELSGAFRDPAKPMTGTPTSGRKQAPESKSVFRQLSIKPMKSRKSFQKRFNLQDAQLVGDPDDDDEEESMLGVVHISTGSLNPDEYDTSTAQRVEDDIPRELTCENVVQGAAGGGLVLSARKPRGASCRPLHDSSAEDAARYQKIAAVSPLEGGDMNFGKKPLPNNSIKPAIPRLPLASISKEGSPSSPQVKLSPNPDAATPKAPSTVRDAFSTVTSRGQPEDLDIGSQILQATVSI